MELPDSFSDIDSRILVVILVFAVMATGFIASSTSSPLANSGGEDIDRQQATSQLSYDSPDKAESDGRASSGSDQDAEGSESDRKVITTVRTTLKVSDVESAIGSIESQVQSFNGFVESSSLTRDSSNRGRMSVSVPAEDLDEFESGLEEEWKVESRDVDRRDVTDSYSEIETELESLRTEHSRLRELINQTDDVENLIGLQERMSEVRSRINYNQQRLDRMDQDIEYSTVHITLEGPQTFESRFEARDTLSDAYSAVFRSVKIIIIGTAYLIPLAVLYGIYRAGKRLIRKPV